MNKVKKLFTDLLCKIAKKLSMMFYINIGIIIFIVGLVILLYLASPELQIAFQEMLKNSLFVLEFVLKSLVVVLLWSLFLVVFRVIFGDCSHDAHAHNKVILCVCDDLTVMSCGFVAYIIVSNSTTVDTLVSAIVRFFV